MALEKAAMFVDNSNIFKGMSSFSAFLRKTEKLKPDQFLRIKWEVLIELLQAQNDGIDIYARHFFASLPPAADVSRLKRRPSEKEWMNMVRKSAQAGFYRVIQNPPFNFTLHAVPLRFAEVRCGNWMRRAYFKCLAASDENLDCSLSLNPDECYDCEKRFLYKFEKGVDVALAAQLVIFGATKGMNMHRIILIAGDGDYKEAIRFCREDLGKDIQLVSWQRPLSGDLIRYTNKQIIILDDIWEKVCEIRERPPLEEIPAADTVEEIENEQA
jgi:hypothetical protein